MFENIFEAADQQHKDIGVVQQFTETAIFIAKTTKKIQQKQFILPVGSFFYKFDRRVVDSTPTYHVLAGDANHVSFFFCLCRMKMRA